MAAIALTLLAFLAAGGVAVKEEIAPGGVAVKEEIAPGDGGLEPDPPGGG